MKVAAMTVGPAGVGLIGLFQNVVMLATSVGGLGISNAAPREIGVERSRNGEEGEAAVGRAVMLASMFLALLSGLLFFLLRVPIASALGEPRLSVDVGWLAIAVAAGVMLASQIALLTACGRIGDAGRANLFGALLATVTAVPIFLIGGVQAPVLYVISVGVVGCLVGFRYAAKLRLGRLTNVRLSLLKPLIGLGFAISASALVGLGAVLLVRTLDAQELGFEGLGEFHASWALASVYLFLVLQAMSADFYPRLSESIADKNAFNRLINEQTEVALLLGGPIILAALVAAPLVIVIFYGGAFVDAASMFRWQLAGDVLKIASWPFSFGILAHSKRGSYFACEAIAWTLFAILSALLLPRMGLAGVGAAYAGMYVAYLPVTWIVLRRHAPAGWSRRVALDFCALQAAALLLLAMASYDQWVTLGGGIFVSAVFGYGSFRRLRHLLPWRFTI
jgi:PST family polysaccharide transporter